MSTTLPFDRMCLGFSFSSTLLLWLPGLPSVEWHFNMVIIISLLCCVQLFYKFRLNYLVLALLFGFMWSTTTATSYLQQIRPYIDKNLVITAEAKSVSMADEMSEKDDRFYYTTFSILTINQQRLDKPILISLAWLNFPLPEAGQKWQLSVKTKATHSYLNEGSYDSQRQAIANRLLLSGSVKHAVCLDDRISIRQKIINLTLPYLSQLQYRGIILALLFGERNQIELAHKNIMFYTGIAHLMAISGMHILLIAWLVYWLVRFIQKILPYWLACWWLPSIFGAIFAVSYAGLSGLNPPALRAILTMLLLLVWRFNYYQYSVWQIINRVIALLLFIDPLLILSVSFWLSCYVVICLIFLQQWFPLAQQFLRLKRWYLLRLLHLQLGITLLIMPLQLFVFQGISDNAIIANLLAIPIVSLITLPILFISLCFNLFSVTLITQYGYQWADWSLFWLFRLLDFLPTSWLTFSNHYYWLSLLGWLMILIWQLELWRQRILMLITAFMTLLSPIFKSNHAGWRIDMLDVGHGLAIVIQKQGHALLYDTGAKWQYSSAAERIIIPFLVWHGLKLDGIIISHQHNDHIGGLPEMQQAFPNAWVVSSSLQVNNDDTCQSGKTKQWQGLVLKMFWPSELTNVAVNPHSCVIQIGDGNISMLLMGDLERDQEFALVDKYQHQLLSTFLQVPHHGSNTSSSYALLHYVAPQLSLISTSRYNIWKLPTNKVLNRYTELSLPVVTTAFNGQLSIIINKNNWQLWRYREKINAKWYHDWFGALPNYR